MAEDGNDRPVAFGSLAESLGIRSESTLGKVANIIGMVGWDLLSGQPSPETIDEFKTQYDAMVKAAEEIGSNSQRGSINRIDSSNVVKYLERLSRIYGVVGIGASGGDTVSSEPRGGHPFRKDSGFRHPYRKE